jgi:hypothetical protein
MGIQMLIDLEEKDATQLAATLECKVSELDEKLEKYSVAATEEYVQMILGQKVWLRGADFREWRLLLIIRHVFDGKLPSESTISSLFQTTTTQSRGLLRSVMSKFAHELHGGIHESLRETISSAKQESPMGPWSVTVDSENIIEALNRELVSIDGTLPPVSKKRGSVITYEIMNSSYEKLGKKLSI